MDYLNIFYYKFKMGNGCYGRTLPKQIHTKIPKYIPTVRRGRVMNVYDGDTITIAGYVDYSPTLYSFSVRFNGLDCPEIKSKQSKDETEYSIALLAKQYIQSCADGRIVTLERVSMDKYGRLLADVYCHGIHLNQSLIEKRLAVVYHGKTKCVPHSWKRYYETGDLL